MRPSKYHPIKLLAGFILVLFIIDIGFHFLSRQQLFFPLFSWKGDVDFPRIGILNTAIRILFLLVAYNQIDKPKELWTLPLFIGIIPFVFLAIDSWYVVNNYVGLYVYWFMIVSLTLLVISQWYFEWLNPPLFKFIMTAFLSLAAFVIFIEYGLILNFNWDPIFIYSLAQHWVYDIGLLVLATLAFQPTKASTSH